MDEIEVVVNKWKFVVLFVVSIPEISMKQVSFGRLCEIYILFSWYGNQQECYAKNGW